jgi:hypothetical protein
LSILLILALLQAAQTEPAELQVKGADMELLEAVRAIAAKVERLRGQEYERPPIAVRAPDVMRQVAAEIRSLNALPRDRLEARGRAWAELGLGSASSPERLLRTLAEDLDGVGFDPGGNRLLVSPDMLTFDDFAFREDADPESTVLAMTGVRVDEPLVGHLLVHVRQLERDGADFLEETTDGLLARSAWAEGEANLLAVRYLFEGMGLADEVLGSSLDPGDFLDGRLVPSSLGGISGAEAGLVGFVYVEGFAQAVQRYLAGGWPALDRAMAAAVTTSDILHPERPRAKAAAFPDPPAIEGLELADVDSLGEQAIVVLISVLTGKDNLGLQAGDGWAGDRLYRWEPVAGSGGDGGVTRWITRWKSAEDAADFEYAMWRALAERFPGVEPRPIAENKKSLAADGRRFVIERAGTEVGVHITPAE